MKLTEKSTLIKMCEIINIKYEDIDFSDPQWYLTHSWTKEQEKDFKNWLINALAKTTICTRHMAEVRANFFILNHGWKTKEE